MAKPSGHLPGTFCWFELSTTDPGAAVAFYTGLLGWKTRHEEMSGGGTYTMLRAGGGDVAGLYELSPQLVGEGVPPHWLSYVATEDVVYMLDGMGIETGVDMDRLLEAGRFISDFLGREPVSRAATAMLRKRAG